MQTRMSAAVATMFAKVKKQPGDVVNPQATRLADAVRLKKITPDGRTFRSLPPPPLPALAAASATRRWRAALDFTTS